MKAKVRHFIHPILSGNFPIAFLFLGNYDRVQGQDLLIPVSLVSIMAITMTFGLGHALKDFCKSSIITTLSLILFMSYGHFYEGLKTLLWQAELADLNPDLLVMPLSILLIAVGTFWCVRRKESPVALSQAFNVFAVSLYLVQAGNLLLSEKGLVGNGAGTQLGTASTPAERPDIYYIIMDAYGRQDVLDEYYGFDNSRFINDLQTKGFFVGKKSAANYCQTSLSLASSLNSVYLDDVAKAAGPENSGTAPLTAMVRQNSVLAFLKRIGYQFVSFSTGSYATEFPTADLYIRPGRFISEFQNVLINTTPLPLVLGGNLGPHHQHRHRIKSNLERLGRLPAIPHPKFVLCHLLCPHPPFVFGPKGEEVSYDVRFSLDDAQLLVGVEMTREEYMSRYCAQLTYMNQKLTEAVETILAAPGPRPVIIIQGDHGPGSKLDLESFENTDVRERMPILNAIYLQGKTVQDAYDSISPVNTFRLVFKQLFGSPLPLLEDRSFYSTAP
jgi:hypothetical protein